MISSSTNDKSHEWNQATKILRRFPENNNNSPTNNSFVKPDLSRQAWTPQTLENDQKIDNLYSTKLAKTSSHLHEFAESPSNGVSGEASPPYSADNTQKDVSFGHLISCVPSQTKSVAKYSRSNRDKEPEKEKEKEIEKAPNSSDASNQEAFVKTVLENGSYLEIYTKWHEYRGQEEIKKCSKKVIERNENIWELVASEFKFLQSLVKMRDVYAKSYPYFDEGSNQASTVRSSSGTRSESSRPGVANEGKHRSKNTFESIESILPGLDHLIENHAKMVNSLINNHIIRPDRVITDIGRVLNDVLSNDLCLIMSNLYGKVIYTKQLINPKLSQFKKYPQFSSYLHKCERDTRTDKKTLPDCLLYISMHWTKIITTLNSLIENTINDSQELNYLQHCKEKINNIIRESENIMNSLANAQQLQNIIDSFERIADCKDSELAYDYMTSENAKLLYTGKVQFEMKNITKGKVSYREVQGVVLEKCMFFLQILPDPSKTSQKYQLFTDSHFPALLEWGKLYGYFREEDAKNSDVFSFYVIIERPEPFMKRLFVSTPGERNEWKKCMNQGFSCWQSEASAIQDAEAELTGNLSAIDNKWKNTQFGFDLIKNLDDSLRVQLEYRTVGFQCILEEELKRLNATGNQSKRGSSLSVTAVSNNEMKKDDFDGSGSKNLETYIPNLTTREGINDWLDVFTEWVNRLKFSLCSTGANITRSASEIEARKRPSIQASVKKCETFSTRDSSTYIDKKPSDISYLNPPVSKQKKDQRRISVTGFTNLFRMSGKSGRQDETDRGSEPIPAKENDRESPALPNADTENEADVITTSILNKDIVVAFNEVNKAAKNITMEILQLRTQKIELAAEVKKLQEENQAFRDFYQKLKKNYQSDQNSQWTSNNVSRKTDSIISPSSVPLPGSTTVDQPMDIFDNFMDTPHPNQKEQKIIEFRQQRESLRQLYDQFNKEKKVWEKDREQKRQKIQNEEERLFGRKAELEKLKSDLDEREKKFNTRCKELQDKMDLFQKYQGISLTEIPTPQGDDLNSNNSVFQQLSQHARSHSDDNTHKRTSKMSAAVVSPISPPLASAEATNYPLDNVPGNANQEIPNHLQGSLINQERQSLKTISSENNLDSRNSSLNYPNPQKPRMTPSTDRRDIFSSHNACFSNDDENEWSSDVDEATLQKRKSSSTKTVSEVNTLNTNTNISRPSSALPTNPAPNCRIPLELAEKSKLKKDKGRMIFPRHKK